VLYNIALAYFITINFHNSALSSAFFCSFSAQKKKEQAMIVF